MRKRAKTISRTKKPKLLHWTNKIVDGLHTCDGSNEKYMYIWYLFYVCWAALETTRVTQPAHNRIHNLISMNMHIVYVQIVIPSTIKRCIVTYLHELLVSNRYVPFRFQQLNTMCTVATIDQVIDHQFHNSLFERKNPVHKRENETKENKSRINK